LSFSNAGESSETKVFEHVLTETELPPARELPPRAVEARLTQAPLDVRTPVAPSDDRAEARDDARSAGDVLAYLETAYQRQLASALPNDTAKAPDEPDLADEPQVPEAATGEEEAEAEIAVPSEAQPRFVDNEVQVVLNQSDTHQSASHHGDLVFGDQVDGSKVEGDVHVGDVTRVQQVALIYQPVFIAPPAEAGRTPKGKVAPRLREPVNPFGSVTISARHNPWKSMLAEPGNPWSTVGPLAR
jgi:hypothetical protein